MSQLPLREIEGAKDLLQDTVEASVLAVADAHLALAQQAYNVLALVPPLAGPVRAIERVHLGLTRGVYVSVLTANWLAGALADEVIHRLERDRWHENDGTPRPI